VKKKRLAGAGLVGVTLGAIGCGEPVQPSAVDPHTLFPPAPGQIDSRGGDFWKRYRTASALHAAWVPPPASPWRPYYKPTLVAAVSIVQEAAAPTRSPEGERAERLADEFAQGLGPERAAVFVDLPGEESVAWNAVLARHGFEPVATFNNWPHQRGVLRLERALGALLYYAEEVKLGRKPQTYRPVFALERNRLTVFGVRSPTDTFDNRYFHSASDFPAARVFKAQAIDHIYYVGPESARGHDMEVDDLNAYFVSLAQAGLRFSYVGVAGGLLSSVEAQPVARLTSFAAADAGPYAASCPYGRSYSHYHYFWSSSRGTWGGSFWSSGGSGSGGFSS